MSSIVNTIQDKVESNPAPTNQHLATIIPSKGSPFEVTHRPTPTPGPNELLIEVKSIAINPVDWYRRHLGLAIASYPTVIGTDIAGIVISASSSVPSDAPKPGTRVAALMHSFYMQGAPDYGGFQTRVLVPAENVVPLPQGMSFNEASLLPLAVWMAWTGWYIIGLPRETAYTPADKQGMLVWGGASSIGSAAVQVAKILGFRVYVTASEKHHEYLKGLGASRVFDYKSEDVVRSIVNAAKEDGVVVQTGFFASGDLKSCMESVEILKELKAEGTAKLASAAVMPEDLPKVEGVEVKFVVGPEDEKEKIEHFHFIFNVWLKEKLGNGELVPSPKIRVVEGGLESAEKAVDEWKKGVSGEKLVLEI